MQRDQTSLSPILQFHADVGLRQHATPLLGPLNQALGIVHQIVADAEILQLLRIAGRALEPRYRRRLAAFRYGPGVYKLDWALDGPIPWRDPATARAAGARGWSAPGGRGRKTPRRSPRPFARAVRM